MQLPLKMSLLLLNSPRLKFSPFLPSFRHLLYHALSDTRSHMHMHTSVLYVLSYTLSIFEFLMSIGAGFGIRNSDRDDLSCPEEVEIPPWLKTRAGTARKGITTIMISRLHRVFGRWSLT